MKRLSIVLGIIFVCSTVNAREPFFGNRNSQIRSTTNIFGGTNYSVNNRQILTGRPNIFGSQNYYGRNTTTILSRPNSTGGTDYFYSPNRDNRLYLYKRY